MQKDGFDVAREWVQRMADLEDEHGGFPGFSGGARKVCPICKRLTNDLSAHAETRDDPGHLVLHIMES